MKIYKQPADVVRCIESNQRIFIHGAVATPTTLVNALTEQGDRLSNVELIHLHTVGEAPYADMRFKNNFRIANLFVGGNVRSKVDCNRVDYLPCFLSEIPQLFRSKRRSLDVALVHLSPPDRHGYCTLGTSVDIALSAVESARVIIAQINQQMPRVHGDGFIHLDKIHFAIEVDQQLPEMVSPQFTHEEMKIGEYASSLVEEGATLQMGIGSIPNAVAACLKNHRHLGVHTEMWSDGILELIQSGAIDNSRKAVHPGKTVSGGQMDFMRGASLSAGGKPIIVMASRTHRGKSKIVPVLNQGAGVVSTRAHVHFIVTEYGIADLFGKTLSERARALINIAHPEDREWLEKQWHHYYH